MPITPFSPTQSPLGDNDTRQVPYHYLQAEEQQALKQKWEDGLRQREATPGAGVGDYISQPLSAVGELRDPQIAALRRALLQQKGRK